MSQADERDEPVLASTRRYAAEFLAALPDDIEYPSIASERDGDIGFEWYYERGKVLSVSVSPTGALAYAMLWGDEKPHAMVKFDGAIPHELLVLIQRFNTGRQL